MAEIKEYVVYKITNKLSGAVYIGCTSNWETRKMVHLSIMNCSVFRKSYLPYRYSFDFMFYGKDHFSIRVVKKFNQHQHRDSLDYERYLTRKLSRLGVPLYNVANTYEFNEIVKESCLRRYGRYKNCFVNKSSELLGLKS